MVKGRSKRDASKKRINANVKGSMSVSDHLKIGTLAPQIMLVPIRARTANWYLDRRMYQLCHGFGVLSMRQRT